MSHEFDALWIAAEKTHRSGVAWPAVNISTTTALALRQRLEDAANQHTIDQRIIQDRDTTIGLQNIELNDKRAEIARLLMRVERLVVALKGVCRPPSDRTLADWKSAYDLLDEFNLEAKS